jgi:hypothetical protein
MNSGRAASLTANPPLNPDVGPILMYGVPGMVEPVSRPSALGSKPVYSRPKMPGGNS